ncbi:MAG TPA: alpha/beta hydrolase [Gemmataceae bacterium]|nr:alpha/beta hydrolase [Gemmataceae bacterium]
MKATKDWINATGRNYSVNAASSGFVHLEKYTAELCETGSGSPIVLIPGLAGGFELLGPLTQVLAGYHRVIRYQLRGENDCFVLRHPFDLDNLVDDLAELLDSLRLENPTIMGLSFGAVIAMKFAIRYPHRLDRLIVQGAGASYQQGLIHQIAKTVLSRFPLPADSPFVNQFFNLLFGGKQKQDALFDFVTRQIWQTDQSMMAHRFQLVEGLDIEDDLKHIRVPTLVLSGERDVLVSPASLQTLCRGIRNVSHVRLPNCGHLAFVTGPELIGKQVEQFFERSNS